MATKPLKPTTIKKIVNNIKKPKNGKIDIPQKDFDKKHHLSIELIPIDNAELLFDIAVTPLGNKTNKLQMRANKEIIIARSDFFSRHTNPPYNDTKAPKSKRIRQLMQKYSQATIKEPHLHINLPFYADKWHSH